MSFLVAGGSSVSRYLRQCILFQSCLIAFSDQFRSNGVSTQRHYDCLIVIENGKTLVLIVTAEVHLSTSFNKIENRWSKFKLALSV